MGLNGAVQVQRKQPLTNDETQRRCGAVSDTTREQLLDGVARLEARGGALLPPSDRAPLGVHESLLKDVVEDILEVEQARDIVDVDELGGDLLVNARRLVVRDPELGRLTLSLRAMK